MADDASKQPRDGKHIERTFSKAVREGKYVLLFNIVIKPRWKWEGKLLPEGSPKFVVYVEVRDSKLFAGEATSAVFKFFRNTALPLGYEYKGLATPMEYLTLPAVDNEGARMTIGPSTEFLAANLVQAFDASTDAEAFKNAVLAECQLFLKGLFEFEQRNKPAFAARKRATCVVTFNEVQSVSH